MTRGTTVKTLLMSWNVAMSNAVKDWLKTDTLRMGITTKALPITETMAISSMLKGFASKKNFDD